MAIKKTLVLTDNFGEQVTFANAYLKVELVNGSKSMVSYDIAVHRAADAPKIALFKHSFVPDMNAGNFIAQAYANAKSLPEYAGAVDC